FPTFTTDVGGYFDFVAPRTTPELFIRWSQLAALTAVSRVHSSTNHGSVYPFTYGKRMLRIYRRYAKAKVRLIPLVDRWSKRASRSGAIGPVRPVVLEDGSRAARSIDDQWLLGKDILVAPVLEEGARSREVYLPRGSRWQRVTVDAEGAFRRQGRALAGGQKVTAPAPIEDIPIYVRAASAGGSPEDGTTKPPSGGEEPPGGGGRAADRDVGAGSGPGQSTSPDGSFAGSAPGPSAAISTVSDGDPGDGGRLPFTGLSLMVPALLGLALLTAGLAARRARG
ncbi:MAG TPA: TIM-barrel domain-containing protein, partial [Thermoleophilaceae bacterium]|nr:TIM-barrel domain-containing protein [Thermoleophilaceae bacterium]